MGNDLEQSLKEVKERADLILKAIKRLNTISGKNRIEQVYLSKKDYVPVHTQGTRGEYQSQEGSPDGTLRFRFDGITYVWRASLGEGQMVIVRPANLHEILPYDQQVINLQNFK